MKKYIILLILTMQACPGISGQEFNPYYALIVDSCSYDTILSNLQVFESAGIKEVGSPALEKTRKWIIGKYTSYGYTDIVEDPFEYRGLSTSNIVVTKTGSVYPDTYVIMDGHYDTRRGAGANDNGSGTVAILEIARLLKEVNTAYSIKFIHFSAEEVGLVGSSHYVENVALPREMDIKLVFNIDAIGGVKGLVNNKITCDRDEDGPPFTNNEESARVTGELAQCVSLYSGLIPEFGPAAASDYMPFEYRGFIITGLYENNVSPYYHSSDDVISNLDVSYIHEVTRAAVGAALHFSNASDGTTGLGKNDFLAKIRVYPNPARGIVSLELKETIPALELSLYDSSGRLLFARKYEAVDQLSLNLEKQNPGLYLLRLESPSGESGTLKIVKE